MPPQYHYSKNTLFCISRDLILGRRRFFFRDATELVKGIRRFEPIGHPPADSNPPLFLVNHYSRPRFRAWWVAIALVAAAGRKVHWPMTSAWTYPDPLRSRLITPLTEWVLARVARMYGFTLMPPMPPRAENALSRAEAVRRVLRLARSIRPAIAMAPEGMDSPDGRLMRPPPGAGRFIAHLAEVGYTLIPVGAYWFLGRCSACRNSLRRIRKPATARRSPP
jgi:1-acyl-sn-glycerol-3-phosphate acyltransferase